VASFSAIPDIFYRIRCLLLGVETLQDPSWHDDVLVPRRYCVSLSVALHIIEDQLCLRFYGINLNTSVVLEQIGYAGKTGSSWEKIFNISTGNLIITALGFVPGYWVTILTVEYLGRKKIQLIGFLMEALFRTSFW